VPRLPPHSLPALRASDQVARLVNEKVCILKPMDALSDSKRAWANDWFNNTLLSRLDDKQKGATLVIVCRQT
jgi:hypothetical protein